jgi:YfiH family protein
MLVKKNNLEYFVPDNIDNKKAAAIFTTRLGGVSGTPGDALSSLNLSGLGGSHDKDGNIRKNYEIIAQELGFSVNNIIYAHQKHTANILVADAGFLGSPLPLPEDYIFDAMLTDVRGIVLTARSADCVPVLFYDGENNAIGAAHCGWRGTIQELQVKTARKMREIYGTDLRKLKAAVGPCISKCCYEVSAGFYDDFINKFGEDIKLFFRSKPDKKYMCDLKSINKYLLLRELSGDNIEISENCTCCEPGLFYSYRRDAKNCGGHAAFIALK